MKINLSPADVTGLAYLARTDYPPNCEYVIRVWINGVEVSLSLPHGMLMPILDELNKAVTTDQT